ncbi:MAG: hypothetical protein V1921_05270 [Candidatus Altiarchaeota archaeon]
MHPTSIRLFLLLAVLVSAAASAQMIFVGVENIPPTVGPVNAKPVTLTPSKQETVNCWAIVTDMNGYGDLTRFEGILWNPARTDRLGRDDNRTHYTTRTGTGNLLSQLSSNVTIGFQVHSQSEPGEWYCELIAYDNSTSGSNVTNMTIFSLDCNNSRKDAGEVLTDCGGSDCQPCLQGTNLQLTSLTGETVTGLIIVRSNTPDSIRISTVDATRLQSDVNSISRSKMSITPYNITLGPYQAANFSVRIEVPSNITPGVFTSNISFRTDSLPELRATLTLNVNAPMIAPSVSNVRISYPIVLEEDATTSVYCNGSVTDYNGFGSIGSIDAIFGAAGQQAGRIQLASDGSIISYVPSSVNITQASNTTGLATFRFELEPNTMTGTWRCTITAEDNTGLTGSNYSDAEVYGQSCSNGIRDADEELADCGGGCQPCLLGQDVYVETRPGRNVQPITELTSYASQPIEIIGYSISDMVSDTGVIPSENIGVTPPSLILNPYERREITVSIAIPHELNKSYYNGTISANTGVGISADMRSYVNIRSRGEGWINVLTDYTCIRYPAYLTVLDEDSLQPIENSSISVYFGGSLYAALSSDSDGEAKFIPEFAGTYNVTVEKERYNTEETLLQVTVCAENEMCSDGIQNQGESGIDCGGPCPNICSFCEDGILDEGEVEVDCGGPCPPCQCQNGLKDGWEEGIDCGGPCAPCPEIPRVSKLVISANNYVKKGDILDIRVHDDLGNPADAIVRIKKRDGSQIKVRTDSEGRYLMRVNDVGSISGKYGFDDRFQVVGEWTVTAYRAGYLPGELRVIILDPAAATSSIFLAVILGGAIIFLLRRRSKTLVDYKAAIYLVREDRLQDYRRLYVTEDTFDRLPPEIPKKRFRRVQLSLEDIENAENVSEEYGMDLDIAKLLVAAEKAKAREVLLVSEPSAGVKQKFHRIKIRVLE